MMLKAGYWLCAPRTATVATAIAVYLWCPLAVQAAPITITQANVWRADRTANPLGFLPSALVPWVGVTTSGTAADTDVTATIGGTTYDLTRISAGVLAGLYFTQIPYDPSLTGAWTINATNTTTTVDNAPTQVRPAFVPVDAMPFLSNVSFTGTGSNITVHWDVTAAGALRQDEQQVSIWNVSNPLNPFTVHFANVPNHLRELDLSSLLLGLGTQYAVEINSVDRNGTGLAGRIDAFSGNWITGWTPTQGEVQLPAAVPEPASLLLLSAGLAGVALLRRRGRSKGVPPVA